MPRVDEFPAHAQREIAARGEPARHHGIEAQKRKTGFLERLANVGLGRRQDEPQSGRPAEPQLGEPYPDRPMRERADPHAAPRHAEPGRVMASMNPVEASPGRGAAGAPLEDDELEIPAFLRRQAN
jgi:cell division protein FtsZ